LGLYFLASPLDKTTGYFCESRAALAKVTCGSFK
jgi:hypothetical protein